MPERVSLPFGSEFSPGQIDLAELLQIAADHEGDGEAMSAAIRARYFAEHSKDLDPAKAEANRNKLAYNCRLSMQSYGLLGDDLRLTETGRSLYALRADDGVLHTAMARHVLLARQGMHVVQCVLDMTAAGQDVGLENLRRGLAERGVDFPAGGRHPSTIRGWLAKAGIFLKGGRRVDEARLREVLGTSPEKFSELRRLTLPQRRFLEALLNTGDEEPQPANEIARLATATHGVVFSEKALPKTVLRPLVEAGFITADKGTTGRGAKPFMVAPTEKAVRDATGPMIAQLATHSDPKLIEMLNRPLAAVLSDVGAEDKYVAGLALEALAFKLMRLLDMTYVATRLRGSATGGAEVDLIFESARLVFSRWQVQCKRTDRVSLDDVAKEVGLTHFLKSNVVVVVTTGEVGPEARRYANKIMADSNLAVVMLDGADLAAVNAAPTRIVDVFEREARHAMKLKTLVMEP